MAEQKATVSVPLEAVRELMLDLRKPYVDPEVQAAKDRNRQRVRQAESRRHEQDQVRWDRCAHLREDGTSSVAWLRNSDNITRGVCQRCLCPFSPTEPSPEVYAKYLRIPTRAPNVVHA